EAFATARDCSTSTAENRRGGIRGRNGVLQHWVDLLPSSQAPHGHYRRDIQIHGCRPGGAAGRGGIRPTGSSGWPDEPPLCSGGEWSAIAGDLSVLGLS